MKTFLPIFVRIVKLFLAGIQISTIAVVLNTALSLRNNPKNCCFMETQLFLQLYSNQ